MQLGTLNALKFIYIVDVANKFQKQQIKLYFQEYKEIKCFGGGVLNLV